MALTHSISAIYVLVLLLSVVVSASASGGYGSDHIPEKSEPKEQEKLLSTTLGIQGIIYCKSGSKLIPLEGAVARVTCLANDDHGFERAPFSILSDATDDKGYFFATLSPREVQENWRLKECRAFLEVSPSETCNVPTDMNQGINGALLNLYRPLTEKKMKLFSVGPFCFADDKSISNGY
ncbi:hypothetical protein ACOSP7_000464 [Xanthoceras sorbifolium]